MANCHLDYLCLCHIVFIKRFTERHAFTIVAGVSLVFIAIELLSQYSCASVEVVALRCFHFHLRVTLLNYIRFRLGLAVFVAITVVGLMEFVIVGADGCEM